VGRCTSKVLKKNINDNKINIKRNSRRQQLTFSGKIKTSTLILQQDNPRYNKIQKIEGRSNHIIIRTINLKEDPNRK